MKKFIFPIILILWIVLFVFAHHFLKKEEELKVNDVQSEIITNDKKVYLNENGEKYHQEGCSYIQSGFAEVYESQVKHAKIPPCKRCNP